VKLFAFSKTYDKEKVVDFPGMELQEGKVYSIIGANGSGKSTFAKILAGILPADQPGKKVEPSVSVGYMPQKSYAFRMSTRANILLGGRNQTRAEQLMDAVQIRQLESKRANQLSGGETARMALARLMMRKFNLVILDEPTAAMDVETTGMSENLILQYVKEVGCALLLVTHSLQQARRVADEALFFYKGRLLEYGAKETVLYTPVQEETKRFLEFYGK
jgi:ABC-type multidrug transport system ATPase subunit